MTRRWRRLAGLGASLATVVLGTTNATATEASSHIEQMRMFMREQQPQSRSHAGAVREAYRPEKPTLLLPDIDALRAAVATGTLLQVPRDADTFNVVLRLAGAHPIAELDPANQQLYATARPEVVGMLLDIGSRLQSGRLDVTSLVRHGEYQRRLGLRNANARTTVPTHAMGLAVDLSILHAPVESAREVRRVLEAMAAHGDLHYIAEQRQLVFHVVPAVARRGYYREMARSFAAASSLRALRSWPTLLAVDPPAPSWVTVPRALPPVAWSHGPSVVLLSHADRLVAALSVSATAAYASLGIGAFFVGGVLFLLTCRRRCGSLIGGDTSEA